MSISATILVILVLFSNIQLSEARANLSPIQGISGVENTITRKKMVISAV